MWASHEDISKTWKTERSQISSRNTNLPQLNATLGVSRGQQLDSRLGRLSCLVFRVCRTSKALFIWLIIRLIRLVFSVRTVFFSHKKSANSVFQPAYNSSRTTPKLFPFCVLEREGAAQSAQRVLTLRVFCMCPLVTSCSPVNYWQAIELQASHPCLLTRDAPLC
jgi:hypothetical protein